MKSPNTDVPASIAGYFYQFLLAVNELTCLIQTGHEGDSVAIEKGADVRVFKQGDKKKSIEAKFYKDPHFTPNHSSICHTLYNFYTSFLIAKSRGKQIDQYEYRTNVPMRQEDKAFFDKWHFPDLWTMQEKESYVTYIKKSIIRDRLNTDRGKKAMNDFKECIYNAEMDAIFKELQDGTSELVPYLQQTIDGQGALSVFRRNDREAKLTKLQELQTTKAYTQPRSVERKAVKPILDNLKQRMNEPGIEELYASLINNKIDFSDFTPIISVTQTEYTNIDLSEEELFEEFAQIMRFSFGDKNLSKVEYIETLKDEIKNNLQKFDASLNKTDCEKIIYALIDKIFLTTVKEDSQGINVKETKKLVEKHHEINQTILKSYLADKLVEEVENTMKQLFSYKLRFINDENAEKMKKITSELFTRYLDAAFCYQMDGMDKFGYIPLEEFNRLFKINDNGVSAEELADILLCLTIMSHYSEDTLEVRFQEKGINNVHLSPNQSYVLKKVFDYGDPNIAIIQFVHYIVKTISENKSRLEGFETVFLFTEVDQLEAQKWDVDRLLSDYAPYVQDIAHVIDVDENKKLIDSFVFKWDCMVLPKKALNSSINFKDRVNNFIRG